MNGFQRKRVDKALENDHTLNAWESDFIQSLDDLHPETELTERQNGVLNKLSEKVY